MSRPDFINEKNIESIMDFVIRRIKIIEKQIDLKKEFMEHYILNDDQFSTLYSTKFSSVESTTAFNLKEVKDFLFIAKTNYLLHYKASIFYDFIHNIYLKPSNICLGQYDYNVKLIIVLK